MAIKTEEELIALVKAAEQDAELNPKSYTTKLALFAMPHAENATVSTTMTN